MRDYINIAVTVDGLTATPKRLIVDPDADCKTLRRALELACNYMTDGEIKNLADDADAAGAFIDNPDYQPFGGLT